MRRSGSALSSQRMTVLTAVSTHNILGNHTVSYYNSSTNSSNVRGSGHHHQGLQTLRSNMHGNVNVMLGGAMLSVVITVLCFVCYCCHRNIKKRSTSMYRQQWLENEANMEIYSVEQCYDTPSGYGPSPVGTDDISGCSVTRYGNYFTDNIPGSEYQPLPANAVQNQQLSHQHPHNFNGPPPSYDTVLAQDELAGTTKIRPKSADISTVSSDGESNARGLSAKLESLLNDPVGNQRRKRNRFIEPDFTDLGRMLSLPGCSEIGNCSCPLSDSLQVYCRKCGQYVDGGVMQNNMNNNRPVGCGFAAEQPAEGDCGDTTDSTNWTGSSAIGCDNLMDCDGDNNGNSIQITHSDNGITNRSISGCELNELLLQDLQFHSPGDTTAAACATGEFNNNNDDRICCTSHDDARHNEENNNNLPSSASLQPIGTIRADEPAAMGTAAVVGAGAAARDSVNDNTNSPNSNGNQESAQATDAVVVGIGPPNGVECNKPADNGGRGVPGNNNGDDDACRNLAENGLVRLDMSQIIDQTGLPTYEAALRLESSGYV
ncbi:uncharacterized protein LOC134210119 [Armigeres subalbatus]|uniref:uncharacterized protein LOC134210119 n=1 Tax=Armigeres subalbatus TaxID=124917 RepID=UPI002ED1E98C